MSGSSGFSNSTTSSSVPWTNSQDSLNRILNQVSTRVGTGSGLNVTPEQQNAINAITTNNSNTPNYTSSIGNTLTGLLSGGGANNQASNVQNNYANYQKSSSPLANNTDYNPYNTPGFGNALSTLNSDITNQINGQFASAGRDMSPAYSTALAKGLSQGESQLLANQYNQNVSNQQNASQNLYNAGNTAANTLSGYQQNANSNQITGLNNIGTGVTAQNSPYTSTISAQNLWNSIPANNTSLWSNIATPIGSLGSSGSSTPSWYSALSGATSGLSGLLSLI